MNIYRDNQINYCYSLKIVYTR